MTGTTRISEADGIRTTTHPDGSVTTEEALPHPGWCNHRVVDRVELDDNLHIESGWCRRCGHRVRRRWLPPLTGRPAWHWGDWH